MLDFCAGLDPLLFKGTYTLLELLLVLLAAGTGAALVVADAGEVSFVLWVLLVGSVIIRTRPWRRHTF